MSEPLAVTTVRVGLAPGNEDGAVVDAGCAGAIAAAGVKSKSADTGGVTAFGTGIACGGQS
jgi:hypothetical protein